MASPATLSDAVELHARLHDLAVVALRTRGRQRDLIAAVPGPSAWTGPAAVAYTSERLTVRAAALGRLADELDAVARRLSALVRSLPPLTLSAGVDARSPVAAVRQAQRLLAAADAGPGPVDGVWGASSVAAVTRVQSRAGLPPTGLIDARTALAISAAAAGGAVVVGGTPGVPHGLLPLAGSHPVMPAAPAPAAGDPTAATDPDPAPTTADATADPTADPSDPDPTDSDPTDSDPTDSDPPDADGGTAEGADPLPSGGTADGGTDAGTAGDASPDSAAVQNLIQRLTPATATPVPQL